MLKNTKKRRDLLAGIAFLTPNIIGFILFGLLPLIFSLVMAFSNWDLRRHNMFKDEPIILTGFENFIRMFTHQEFWRYFGNTLFFMLSIPFAVAGSLLLALLLTKDLRGGNRRVFGFLVAGSIFVASAAMMTVLGAGTTGIFIVFTGMACMMLVLGSVGGATFYRTVFKNGFNC